MSGSRRDPAWKRYAVIQLTSLVLLAALAGCTTSSGQDFSAANAAQIRSGVTDKATVEKNLGQPLQRYVAPNGDETWLYSFGTTTMTPTATAFVPFFGPILPGSQHATSDSRQVTIMFHGDIVSSCKLTMTTSKGSGTYLGGGGVVSAQLGTGAATTQQTDCGDAPNK